MNIYETHSAEETFALGKKIGESAEPDTVIALIGDIGNGKTVFTKGVAAGLGMEQKIQQGGGDFIVARIAGVDADAVEKGVVVASVNFDFEFGPLQL